MSTAMNLSEVSNDDLVDELLRRSGLVASIWNTEDTGSAIEEDEDCPELTDEQFEQAAALLLARSRKGLQEVLAERGNEYLATRWVMVKEEILEEVAPAAGSKPG